MQYSKITIALITMPLFMSFSVKYPKNRCIDNFISC